MSYLKLALLGSFSASLDDKSLNAFRTKAVQALLIYLVCQPEEVHRREHLMALIWPGLPQKSAQSNLRQTSYRLRLAIPELTARDGQDTVPFLITDRQTIQVNPEVTFELDVSEFESLLAGPLEGWTKAVALYRGDFLADFYLPASASFEEWVLARREALRRRVLPALEKLAELSLDSAAYDTAEQYARRQIQIDELRESAHQQLMTALPLNGRRIEALAHYDKLRQLLERELGAEPSAETLTLYDHILSGNLEELAGRRQAPSAETKFLAKQIRYNSLEVTTEEVSSTEVPVEPALPRHVLPVDRTPFVGRENELAELDRLLADPGTRLVTIFGPGGIGKTRLVLAAAARQLSARIDGLDEPAPHKYRDGIFFVSLEAVDSVAQIPASINKALGFRPSADDRDGRSPWQQTLDFLASRHLLLILDNFEQLLHGVDYLVAILERAPNVKFLVTSREKLSLHSERLFPLEGMDCPNLVLIATAARQLIETFSAPRLFIQSARRLRPDFTIVDDEIDDLGRICRLVGGMPLGLELAAGWIELLSLADIVDEIQQNLDVLETSARDIPERQRSMVAVFESSWQRLDSSDQILLSGLSVFRGGFNREAAQQVTGATLRQLATLVGKSLIQYDKDGDRFEIHRLLGQYLATSLAEDTKKEQEVQDRHCTYYCSAIRGWAEALKGEKQQETIAEMETDSHNMLKAWSWAVARRHIDQMDDAGEGLFMYFDLSGNYLR